MFFLECVPPRYFQIKKATISALLILLMIALNGCTYSMTAKVPLKTPPLIEPLPFAVAVYYNHELRDFRHRQTLLGEMGKNEWSFLLGAANIELFDLIFPEMFKDVTFLKTWPTDKEVRGVLMVIEPSIDHFHIHSPHHPGTEFPTPFVKYAATIEYRLTFYSPDGIMLGSNVFSGEGELQHTFVSEAFPLIKDVKDIYNDVIQQAMREAATHILTQYRSDPTIHQIMRHKQASAALP